MKILSSILFCTLLVVTSSLSAQENTTSYNAGGIKVIHKQVPNEVVAVRLYVRGGTANYPIEKEGIETLAFEMALFGGTQSRSADELLNDAHNLGIGLSSKSGYDYGYLGMTALEKFWDESWELWAEAVTQPSMTTEEYEMIRDDVYARNRRASRGPEEQIEQLSMVYTFGGTDYAKVPSGTSGSLYDITIQDVQDHYNKILTKNNCFIVVVGDISTADLTQKIESAFGSLPEGEAASAVTPNTISSPGVTIQHSDLEMNHILGRMPAPARWSDEDIPNMLAMNLLSDRLVEVMTNENQVSYAPSAFMAEELRYPSNGIYAATVKPVRSVELMVEEINRIDREGFSADNLRETKPSFTTLHYLAQETMDAQAHYLGDAEISGDWRRAGDITPQIQETSVEDVNAVFRKYSTWINWTYLGNASQVESDDFPQPAEGDVDETGTDETEDEEESPGEE